MRPVRLENVKTSSQCASFALLPFSNRIRDAAFDFAGEHVQLRVTTADGLTQHGDVRNRPWQLARQTPGSLTFTFDSRDFDDVNWPWAFTAEMHYELRGPDFVTSLSLTNSSERPMPAGMGLHPYFDISGGPTLQLEARGWYQNDERSLPLGAALPLPEPPELSAAPLHSGFKARRRAARLERRSRVKLAPAPPSPAGQP